MTTFRHTPTEARHLDFIRALPCVICQRHSRTEAAHVRFPCAAWSKEITGNSRKPDPWWTVPLCASCHRTGPDAQHTMGERDWWHGHGHDPDVPGLSPLALCSDLWAASEARDHELALASIAQHRMNVAMGSSDREPTPPPVVERPAKRRRGKGPENSGRKLEGRGFDKTHTRRFDGTVVAR